MAMGAATGATANFVLVPLLFIAVLFVSAIWEVDRIGHLSLADATHDQAARSPRGRPPPDNLGELWLPAITASARRGLPSIAPRLEGTAHIAMCVTMGYMLVLML